MPGLLFQELDIGIHSARTYGPTWASGHSSAKTKRAITTRRLGSSSTNEEDSATLPSRSPGSLRGCRQLEETQNHTARNSREHARLKATVFGRRGVQGTRLHTEKWRSELRPRDPGKGGTPSHQGEHLQSPTTSSPRMYVTESQKRNNEVNKTVR